LKTEEGKVELREGTTHLDVGVTQTGQERVGRRTLQQRGSNGNCLIVDILFISVHPLVRIVCD